MANLLERMFNLEAPATALREVQAGISSRELLIENTALQVRGDRLEESMSDLMTYLEDLNWIPLGGWEEDKGFSIDTIKENADRIRALLTVNPTIKKAVNARIGYIWGRGVGISGGRTNKMTSNERNKSLLFDATAQARLETQLATDGNIWVAKDKVSEEAFILPINQIAGWVLDERDQSRVNYWLRRYTIKSQNFSTGVPTEKHIEVFYPAADYTGSVVNSIEGIKVDRSISVVHTTANRQEGWILGIPDILAAMFWAKAHKELFEAGTTYVKAQGKFASKVVSKTKAGATSSAARIAEAPRRDPVSGEVLDSGGTAVMSGGLDYQLMGKMSGGVDFKQFDPVAGLVAVGLGIPLEVILGTSENDERALERTTVDEMQLRQKLWTEFYTRVVGGNVQITWPKIRTEPEYRRVQSLELSNKSGTLSREELRQLTLEAYDLDGSPSDLPAVEENWVYMLAKATADDAAKHAEKQAELAATVPEQGVDAGIGKLSTGDDAKNARDDSTDKNVKD